jgi:hypothetical protein
LPTENNKITFIKKNIGFENNDNITNLHDIINEYNNIFIKMDIEGGEIPWIKSLNNKLLNKFQQIVIEFHNPFTIEEKDIFKKINNNHILIHFHGNNCCDIINYKNVIIPTVFECTYLHKKYFINKPILNIHNIPSNIDMSNIITKKDIYINYPPFVHKNNLNDILNDILNDNSNDILNDKSNDNLNDKSNDKSNDNLNYISYINYMIIFFIFFIFFYCYYYNYYYTYYTYYYFKFLL